MFETRTEYRVSWEVGEDEIALNGPYTLEQAQARALYLAGDRGLDVEIQRRDVTEWRVLVDV